MDALDSGKDGVQRMH